ncbi:MAG TPA: cysteine hydrolase family protein [Bryobacteraceae bacterium]|nr:cysteine hydrolase family protein [Bryobacteraceae bacterium]
MSTVFFDVDTQLDFMLPAGALYAPGAENIIPAIARLNRWAAEHSIPVVSTMDAHAENDPEFAQWPAHCVAGTLGQRKPTGTLTGSRHQVIVEKQALDCFSNPDLPGLLDRLGAGRSVVYGVVTEHCVRLAALGLLQRGRKVEVVTDAIVGLARNAADAALAQIQQAGGRLTTVAEVCRG